ncbi:MAG: hypothetical protein ACYC6H_11220, partial [Bellilinea sp.]
MKTVLIFTMHGAPPRDFPRRGLGEFFALHMQMENSPQRVDDTQQQRYNELNSRFRSWPRPAANDPFFTISWPASMNFAVLPSAPRCAPRQQ